MRYLILERGEYSSYEVDFMEVPERCSLTNKEILVLINANSSYENYTIAGKIIGEIKGWEPIVLKTMAEFKINDLFYCYSNRKYKTVLDREYTEEELFQIATANNTSGAQYWEREAHDRYQVYKIAYKLYRKLIDSMTQSDKGGK